MEEFVVALRLNRGFCGWLPKVISDYSESRSCGAGFPVTIQFRGALKARADT